MSSAVGALPRPPPAHRPGALARGIAVAFGQEAFLAPDEEPEVDLEDDRQHQQDEAPEGEEDSSNDGPVSRPSA